MNEDTLFLRTLADLQQRADTGDRYELIRAAGLLRQLLLDRGRLVDLVNRTHGLKIHFRYVDMSPPPLVESIALHWMPPTVPMTGAEKIVEGKLASFLKEVCLRVKGKEITVHELLSRVANAGGGVHYKANDPTMLLLNSFDEEVRTAMKAVGLEQVAVGYDECIRRTIRVVLNALDPLRKAVEGSNET